MPPPPNLAKAELRQLDAGFANEIEPSTWTTVQFNPETLKVSFANQVQTPSGTGDQRGPQGQQFVGAGTTKLAVALWFDVTALAPGTVPGDDVRQLTKKVAYFITPKKDGDKYVPPAVRFVWGSFQFEGMMDSLEESLELFSPEGRPLRASVSFTLSQQRISEFVFRPTAGGAAAGPRTPGTRPLAAAPEGGTVQGLAAAQGAPDRWRAIAEANGIENPRMLAPGQLVDVQAGSGR